MAWSLWLEVGGRCVARESFNRLESFLFFSFFFHNFFANGSLQMALYSYMCFTARGAIKNSSQHCRATDAKHFYSTLKNSSQHCRATDAKHCYSSWSCRFLVVDKKEMKFFTSAHKTTSSIQLTSIMQKNMHKTIHVKTHPKQGKTKDNSECYYVKLSRESIVP